jgi:preprotein translocase subunit SecY
LSQASKTAAALAGSGKFTELRQRLLFVLGALIVYRLGTFIPVPGVDPDAMLRFMDSQQGTIVDLFNMFSGGALERFSLFALNVMPYISASIIVQLCAQIFPSLQALRKEGESGRRKLTQYTRIGTIALALFQSWGVAIALQSQSAGSGINIVMQPGPGFLFTAVVSLTAGTMFLMWLGEQITERGVGNGISLIIFAGIVAGLPGAVMGTLELVRNQEIGPLSALVVFAIVLLVTAFVVFVERGQRRITVNYARRQGGRQAYLNQSSHLPLKLNMSGVIPPIFASSLIMFPATASSWFSQASDSRWLQVATHLQLAGDGGESEEVRSTDSRHPAGQGDGGLYRRRADSADGMGCALPRGGVLVARNHAIGRGGAVLLRWTVPADRCCRRNGFHGPDPGSSDVPSVREPDEEGQSEGRFARRLRARIGWPRTALE